MSELFRGQPMTEAESERRRKVRERSQRRRDKAKEARALEIKKAQGWYDAGQGKDGDDSIVSMS